MSNFSFEPLKLKLATNNIIIPMENGVADLTNAETSAKIMLAGKELFPIFDERLEGSIGGRNLLSSNFDRYTLGTPYNYMQLVNEPVDKTISIFDKDLSIPMTGMYFGLTKNGYNYASGGVWMVDRGEIKRSILRPRVDYNSYYYFSYYMNNRVMFDKIFKRFYIKAEIGDNPNPIWTPAPEDVLQFATLTSYNCSAAIVGDLIKITSHKPDTKRGWVDVTVNYGNLSNTKRLNWSVEGVEPYKPTGTLLTMNNRGIIL